MFELFDGRKSFYQWDLNQKLIILDDSINEVHFCNKTEECALVCEVYKEDNLNLVNVPNILLQEDWSIRAYAVAADHTEHCEVFKVISRSKPADYAYTETEVKTWEELNKRIEEAKAAFSPEALNNIVAEYLEENPVKTGATKEEAAQIAKNKQDIENLSVLSEDAYIVNNGKGSEVTINDSINRPLRGLTIYGKTTQNTYEGKNLFNDVAWFIDHGFTKQSDGSWKCVSIFEECWTNTEKIAGSMYITAIARTEASGSPFHLVVSYTDGTREAALVLSASADFITLTHKTNSEKTVDYIQWTYGGSGIEINEYYLKGVMFSFVEGEYEPYAGGSVSPSPNYPQELISTGASGAINVNVAGKKIFDDAEWFKKNNATLQSDGSWNGVASNKILFINSSRKSGSVNLAMTAKIDRDTTKASFQVTYTDNTSDNYCAFQLANDFETKTAETNPDKTVESIALQTSGSTNGLYVKDIMIAFGDNEYDPAIDKQTLTILTPNGLNGVPMPTDGGSGGFHYIPDYIDENGKAYITDYVDLSRGVRVQRFKTAVITQAVSIVDVINGFGQFGIDMPAGRKFGSYCLCSHYKVPLRFDQSLWSDPTYTGVVYKRISSNPNRLFAVHEGITTLEDYNAWLAENKPVFLYELAEPIEIPLTAEEIEAYKALHTNKPNTTIYADSGAGLNVDYVADTKLYIDNRLSELSNAILSLGGNI